ncbi:hypothetical protein SAMN05192558_11829 [Actinokineospora alba]|uniref:Uncharacterized protein n=1 Tax=Actinokineospora alba TaxID=504798 RepID=A0A1H0W6U9_9PSEU|nr:DUF5691 domain-containing protein [Actinokineospora alba]TDP70025.1 hypothetical protein C8E96_5625 [Actinokineospora alba]SDJ49673.1 hypothetical protein SAMN05421871_11729 [Actinokineospora alba]SDP86338.1 hypothetical protein SAMN05192558_11829 [Actinokineospora alba]
MSGWDELVAAALLGTRRRVVHTEGLPESVRALVPENEDPATRLLTAAALMAGYRRAGRVPETGGLPVQAAAEDSRAVIPAVARRRLDRMLSGDHTDLLGDWLDLVRRTDLRLPPERLPILAELARTRHALRSPFAEVAGARGGWLGALNPEWSYLADHRSDIADVWRYGDTDQRVRWLRETFAADPAAAGEALARDWSAEPAANRVRFLRAVRDLVGDDFLEAALDDRAQEVRALAADILAGRPASAFAARMAERLRALVTVADATITVRLPTTRDDSMARDGVPAAPARGGQRTAWLRHIVAAAPLAGWERNPADLLGMPVQGCDPGILLEAWAAAAARQRDVAWARALLTTDDLTTPETAALVNVLPAAERARTVAELGGARKSADLAELVVALPAPWPVDLGNALLDWLAGHTDHRAVARAAGMIARTVPAECLRHRVAVEPLPPDAPAWRRHLSETLVFRREMAEELR